MVAFNFKPEFVKKILAGKKLSTIRSTKRCEIGDNMELYVGQRTRWCAKLMDTVCIGTGKIVIDESNIWRVFSPEGKVLVRNKPLHIQEGFQNAQKFLNFFDKQYGLPYTGYIHTWYFYD